MKLVTILKKLVILVGLLLPAQSQAEDGWFVQVPLTSAHWGDAGGYDFNSENYGIGVGYTWEHTNDWDTSLSVAIYNDSYYCDAVGVRLRHVYQLFDRVAVGGSVHLTDKCTSPTSGNETFVAPTASFVIDVTDRFAIAVDAAPVIDGLNQVGFAAISAEFSF